MPPVSHHRQPAGCGRTQDEQYEASSRTLPSGPGMVKRGAVERAEVKPRPGGARRMDLDAGLGLFVKPGMTGRQEVVQGVLQLFVGCVERSILRLR
jgi:hypothetical protein